MRARPILILSLALLAVAGCRKAPESRAEAPAPSNETAAAEPEAPVPVSKLYRSRAGERAPDTEFDDPDGEPVAFARFAGKPLLVNFWATWCAPCVAEMPTLDALAAQQAGKLQVLTISEDLNGHDKVEAFFAQHRFRTIEPYLDGKMALTGDLKLQSLPTTILFDAEGKEVWRAVGQEDWGSEKTAKLIREGFGKAG